MRKKDKLKLLAAGYTFIKRHDVETLPFTSLQALKEGKTKIEASILYRNQKHPTWEPLEKDFPSVAARDARLKELHEDSMTILDP